MAWVKVSTKTTGADGAVTFDNLPYGNYRIEQATAKTGYTADPTPVPVTISSATPVTEALENAPAASGTLVIDKFSEGYPDWKLAGAQFKLTDSNDQVMLTLSPPSDAGGVITFANLMSIVGTPQTYKVIEMVAPTGYNVDATPVSAAVTVNTTTTENIADTPTASGSIDIDLTDTFYSEHGLANSDYDLYVEVV